MRGLRREALWRRTGCTAAAGREKAGRSTAGGASPCVAICALSAALACSVAACLGGWIVMGVGEGLDVVAGGGA